MTRSASSPIPRPLARATPRVTTAPTQRIEGSSDATQRLSADAPPSRLGRLQLAELAGRLPDRDRSVVELVARIRLARSEQLQRLFFHEIASPQGRARICRRSLQTLTDTGVVRRLERRVGGSAAGGSSGYVYTLAPAGRRLVAYWRGEGVPSARGVHEPQAGFVEHTLAVTDLYVRLVEAEREQPVELLGFETEPDCWRAYIGQTGTHLTLKPDALVRVGTSDDELAWWIEVDMGTHGRGAVARKLNAYLVYFRTGREQAQHGIFPRVVFITATETRAAFLRELVDGLPAVAGRLFCVATTDEAIGVLAGTEELQ